MGGKTILFPAVTFISGEVQCCDPNCQRGNKVLPPNEVSRNGELEYGPQDNPFLRCDIRKISWGGAMLIISEMAEGDKTERRDDNDRRRV